MELVAALALLLLAESPFIDEHCAGSFACNEKIIYELVYGGIVLPVPAGDMTKAECEKLKADIQIATQAMSDLVCRPRLVERQES